jgi:hypothetical protein
VDEFGSFALVSRAVRRSLEGDRQLAVLLELALDEAGDSLARDGSGVVQVLVLVDPGRNLERLQRRSGRAAALRLRFLVARAGGARAIGLGRRAAKAYRACRRRAERIVERQDRRDPAWSVVFHGLPGALLGVWADDDPVLPSVYAVGADDLDVGPQFVRLGGDGWVRIAVPVPGDLWWVAGVAGEGKRTDAVFACGSEGAVVRYDPATGAVDDVSVPWVSHTLFGVWGASRNDVWIVGGGPAPAGGSEPVLAHFDGTTWTAVVVPSQATQRVLFKVWGNAADDIFACGSGGVLLHYDGAEWTAVPTGTVATLLTVHGRPGTGHPVAAVGGPGVDATITERTGADFALVPLPGGIESLNGIAFDRSGNAFAAGVHGTVLRRDSGSWSVVRDVPTPGDLDHHAVAIDGAGGAWFVGGSLTGTLDRGFLVHYGPRSVPTDVLPQADFRGHVAPVLSAACATIGCHLEPFANEGLDLYTPETILRDCVDVPSNQSPLPRITPGRPSQSYLWHKLKGTQAAVGGGGDRMPGSGLLPDADLDAIRAWIREGAPSGE